MKNLLAVIFGLLLAGVSSSDWHYGHENQWPEKCKTGTAQSPINLDEVTAEKISYDKFVFKHYELTLPAKVENNGHSVKLTVPVSSTKSQPMVKGGGLPQEYFLDHLHFHWKSEHTVNNYRFPLELHLVHFASAYHNLSSALQFKDGVAVLGVLYDLSPDDDTEFQPLINVLKSVEKPGDSPASMDATRVKSFLPRDTAGFYRYNGSLTTPECTEAVIWTVFTNTMPISHTQVKRFEDIRSKEGALKENYRSLQALQGRTVYRKVSPIRSGSAKSANLERFTLASFGFLIVWRLMQ